jgi:hypothetical protein
MTPADRTLTKVLLSDFPRYGASGKYTLNYRVGSRSDSVQGGFFINGNRIVEDGLKHLEKMPWTQEFVNMY